ncbi:MULTISPECIES: GNAT family N-acetyltransferase [Paenibacillus]|uniref:Ribosomal protein S18 acetylase RimI-like enzyme n=1 Tax=Paenibacillus pabuli TaxID=1472 RepID=A0A855Y0D8_9BACL|nr:MULTISPECIES: GNAT family N-acetyltransferase [Paenibacillus]PWW43406.1 ribosomal protein S18 acetylase RimI-like enzyme [Paenibacillus pabuli]PXW09313.1 ribosomal protein S18 acetylase RimI-like enzyme [Paenibacillus taichungensis]
MTITSIIEQIRIIEYDPSYAAALANMWNRSNESWGGGTNQRTEDTVRREMETSSNLHVFLAVHEKEVVGFCSFAHYRYDENALYVPLLNVRPDYHGYKVGRNLILNAVRKTVEAGWPRLDLFTWAGNTKAVPMYKKCGFFWEKKDDNVHLMNFIPTILQTEALAPYLEELDWYADSTRELLIEPDGRRERGFDFFDYSWQKGDISLRAEFEKSGRGLTALETPDYEISTEIDDHDLVFGSAYKVRYRITNRSASELKFQIKGQDNKNIRFALDAARAVAPGETVIVEGEFHLDPVQEEQSQNKTHPVVTSTWLIGGRKAEFRMGVAPKFPAKINTALHVKELYTGIPAELYLNVENNFDAEAEFTFDLPEEEFLEWAERSVSLTVPAKGKASVPVAFTLRSYGLYSREVEVTAVPTDRQAVSFTTKLSVLMKGTQGRYGGENGEQWVAVNGAFSLHMSKQENNMWIEYPGSVHTFWWTYPKLGKPFAEEFSKKQAKEVNIYPEGENQVLEALYESEDFPGIEIKTVVKLSANGIAEFHHEIGNKRSAELEENMFLMTNFGFFGNRLILPYQGRYVDMGDAYSGDPSHWDSAQITENWLFCKEEYGACGIYWDPSLKLLRPERTLGLQHELGRIPAGAVVQTKATVFALNTFAKWEDFRSFAQKRHSPVVPKLDNHLELALGGGNPFAQDVLTAELIERKMIPLAGNLELYVQNGGTPEHVAADMELNREQDLRSAKLEFSPEEKDATEEREFGWKVRAVYRGEDRIHERTALWYPQTGTAVDCVIEEGPAGPVYTVSNGVLSMAAAPGFGSVVHSLKYQGQEWLDSTYPEAAPRSWWNPWYGGLGVGIPGMNGFSRQLEQRSAAWTERKDEFGNVWKGIQLTTRIEKHEANRGITIQQHYLMLPGVPVLCELHSVTNESGLALDYSLAEEHFFKPSPVFADGWLEHPEQGRYPLGKVDGYFQAKGFLRMGAVSRKDMLHAVNRYPNQNAGGFVNNVVLGHNVYHNLPLLNGETVWTEPTYLILGQMPLNPEDVRGLLQLDFATSKGKKEA